MIIAPIKALGTIWHIEVFDTDFDQGLLHEACSKWLAQYELQYSRFVSDSWISVLNRDRVILNPDPQLVDLLQLSLEYYQKTAGVFNIAIGEKIVNAGYNQEYSFVAGDEQSMVPVLPDILSVTDQKIEMADGQLDLGGIGKGYAIDALSTYLTTEYDQPFHLINGGGDMYGTSDQGEPIQIHLSHPTDKTLSIGTTEICNNGFASSSPFLRKWHDPNTGKEENHLLTTNTHATYVVAPTAVAADVWATTLAVKLDVFVPQAIKSLAVSKDGSIKKSHAVFNLHTRQSVDQLISK
jgi:thiamine biosynthesis lipoprotein